MGLGLFLQKYRIFIAVFILALVARLGLFFIYLNHNNGDFIATIRGADGYFEISENLIKGNGYSDSQVSPFVPNSMRPPTWIFTMAFIAKVFGSYVPVYLFQLLMACLVPILGMYLARRIISDRHSAVVGILLAIEPASVFSSTMVVSEVAFSFLFLLFILFLFRYIEQENLRNIIWSGVFLGLAILIKPTVQFLPIVLPIALLFFYRKRLSVVLFKQLASFVFVSLLILCPWFYRNYAEFGTIGLTSQAPYNLYTVLVPTVLSIENGTEYSMEQIAINKTVDLSRGGITPANGNEYTGKALSIISQHKFAFVKSILISIVTFFTHDHMLTVLGYGGVIVPNVLSKPAVLLLTSEPLQFFSDIVMYAKSPGILVLSARLFFVFITILFFLGVWLYMRGEKFSVYAYFLLGFVAYFALLTAVNGFGMNGRFRVPVSAFIFTFAVYGCITLWKYVKKYV